MNTKSLDTYAETQALRIVHQFMNIETRQERLVSNMRDLAQRLTRAADNLEKIDLAQTPWIKPSYLGINSLGEVQARGLDIDRECGELSLLVDVQYRLTRALAND